MLLSPTSTQEPCVMVRLRETDCPKPSSHLTCLRMYKPFYLWFINQTIIFLKNGSEWDVDSFFQSYTNHLLNLRTISIHNKCRTNSIVVNYRYGLLSIMPNSWWFGWLDCEAFWTRMQGWFAIGFFKTFCFTSSVAPNPRISWWSPIHILVLILLTRPNSAC